MRIASLILICLLLNGCALYRRMGNGQRLDASRKPHEPSERVIHVQAQVTTDAAGAVVDERIVKSSGRRAVDNYVLESIRSTWPGGPSTVTLVELGYSEAMGFTVPKILSTSPAP